MRIKHKANIIASVDQAGKDKLFGLDDVSSEVVLDGFTAVSTGTDTLVEEEPFEVPLAGITDVRGFFLKGSGEYSLSINSGDGVTIKLGVAGTSPSQLAASAKVLMEANVESIVVTPVAEMTLTYAVWGDPVEA